MYKLLKCILALTFVFALTSCANVDYNMEINEDGSANLSYILRADEDNYKNYIEKYNTTLEKLQTGLNELGFSVNTSTDNNETTFEAKIYIDDIKNLDSFNTVLDRVSENEPTVSYMKNIFFEEYKINAKIDLVDYDATANDASKDEYVESNLNVNFNLTLPVENASKSNADIVDGNKLTWKLKYNQENLINVEYKIINMYTTILLVVFVFILVQILVILLILKLRKCNNN